MRLAPRDEAAWGEIALRLGGAERFRPPRVRDIAAATGRPESDVRVFSHDDSEARRPLGAAVVTAADVTAARSHAREVSTALRRLW